LYFEEPQLERHGHHIPAFQPIVSSSHSYASLPYQVGANLPWDCIYTLGHYRQGDNVPFEFAMPPLSLKGGVSAAAIITGLIAIP